mmetsp:Transcript_20818/g.79838  ORF Transcript_20818/g.79838 Transcript_20818/m.79838 type:complete len:353 (-) Transcript_20818:7021-8079(-)
MPGDRACGEPARLPGLGSCRAADAGPQHRSGPRRGRHAAAARHGLQLRPGRFPAAARGCPAAAADAQRRHSRRDGGAAARRQWAGHAGHHRASRRLLRAARRQQLVRPGPGEAGAAGAPHQQPGHARRGPPMGLPARCRTHHGRAAGTAQHAAGLQQLPHGRPLGCGRTADGRGHPARGGTPQRPHTVHRALAVGAADDGLTLRHGAEGDARDALSVAAAGAAGQPPAARHLGRRAAHAARRGGGSHAARPGLPARGRGPHRAGLISAVRESPAAGSAGAGRRRWPAGPGHRWTPHWPRPPATAGPAARADPPATAAPSCRRPAHGWRGRQAAGRRNWPGSRAGSSAPSRAR